MKISDALGGFWLERRRGYSRRTVENYTRIFSQLVAHLGDREFETITANDLRRHLDYLELDRGLSKRSVYDAWVGLSALWTWAAGELGTTHVIRGKIRAPKFPDSDIDPFTRDEIRRLLIACDYTNAWETQRGRTTQTKRDTSLRDRAIILVLVDGGLRASELCNLLVSDYDTARGRVHIRHGKGDKPRYVFLGDRSRKSLWKYFTERTAAKPGQPLFATRSLTHITRHNLHHLVARIGDRADVPNTHPHRFRHTMAITFLRNGGNVLELQKILGHEDLTMVKRYVKLAEVDLEKAVGKSVGDNWKL